MSKPILTALAQIDLELILLRELANKESPIPEEEIRVCLSVLRKLKILPSNPYLNKLEK